MMANFTNIINLVYLTLILIMCGDIEVNPGPVQSAVKICHSNIRSLNKTNLDHINFDLCPYFDIICLSETNLFSSRKIDFDLNLPGFQKPFQLDRENQRGGGVCVYISDTIGAIRHTELEKPNLEAIWLEIKCLYNKKFFLCVCYRPPNSSVDFWDEFNESILNVRNHDPLCNLIIAGDLNAHIGTRNWQKLKSVCEGHNLTTHIDKPTRYSSGTSTVLDQFITNMYDRVRNVSITDPVGNSDHCTISIELFFGIIRKKTYSRLIWEYNHCDFDHFRMKLSNYDWDSCFKFENINEMTDAWTTSFLNIARECIPNKIVKIYPNDKPFYNS